ncbi:DUF4123 domain-containing protein [Sphingomonas jatrophae]|uniref:DUF4123 domain-containing protein n=1 Tax=Sphingomonas jatrophae TaxID=1166337 RepID=A0A1I6LKE4_9SPHN|nr:DUF4123 domain-containing protein [Sphingomonas jatrophae]SFS03916.1 protein of unknown function [Sphingomonas jatrophae]
MAVLRSYAIADMARAPQLYPMLQTLQAADVPCLFAGKIAEEVRRASPFLFAFDSAPTLIQRWAAEGPGQAWGLFLTSAEPLETVRRHVRKFMQVRLPDGSGPVLFRFWDPRVFAPFLAATEKDQLTPFFGPIQSWVIESPQGLMRHIQTAGGLKVVPANFQELL